ncbi:TPM domain-containing protein [Hymenobacter sp. AT01-02]|uniref:TPM domain-containing protein n=1 Tax=Hymenobacter sp. AT01-02 TaxID=1571877 RepID=UPI0006960421|nr:TPM domain-containing protein [Hymenobacter sp. AT01-02]
MNRFLIFLLLLVATGLGGLPRSAAQSTEGLPARPSPFRFVTDEGKLLNEADAKTLESGLRRYADNTGTQIVLVTVPSLGGRDVADYGRALGESWGIGQRDKNNGVVVLIGAQDRKVTIQAGSGLRNQITPELTSRVINQQMTPSFKQGRYFAGVRSGLNALMLAAHPESNPNKDKAAAATNGATAGTDGAATSSGIGAGAPSSGLSDELPPRVDTPEPVATPTPVTEPASSGFGIGTLVLGALVIGGGIWLVSKLFRRRTQTPGPTGTTPDFLPNRPNQPTPPYQPNQPNRPTGNYGNQGGYGGQPAPDFLPNRSGGTGSGMGGMLMTGAAAAAGAYLGNRMANGHSDNNENYSHLNPQSDPNQNQNLDAGTAAAGGAAAGGFPFLGDSGAASTDAGPDYFSEDVNDSSPDYFSSDDNGSYDDTSSDDTGGGGFDDDNSNSGSW